MLNEYRDLIFSALKKVQGANIDIYSFALYHDHESGFVSVCIDTKDNSLKTIHSSNEFTREQFLIAIENGDLQSAGNWRSNGGRSFELGNYKHRNLEEIKVPIRPKNHSFYLEMVKAIEEMSELISRNSSHGKDLVFCCSTATEEVGLIWCP